MKIVEVNLQSADRKNTWTGTLKEEEYLQLLATGWTEKSNEETDIDDVVSDPVEETPVVDDLVEGEQP